MDILKQPKAALLLILITLAACSGSSVGFQSAVSGGNTVDSNMPVFEHRLDTDHFVLKWTNRSSHTADNISDPAVGRKLRLPRIAGANTRTVRQKPAYRSLR